MLPGFVGSRIGLWRSAARRSVLAHIMQLWPGERGALMQAMLIGGRAFFGRDIKTEFQRTGTYHILVVSGINVGILAFAVFWALRKLPFGETWATILTILLSWGYAFLADLGSPIVRATITLGIYLVTRLLFRDRAALNGLGIAALGILLVNPRTLFEASFQLTFLSVIAVAGIAVPDLAANHLSHFARRSAISTRPPSISRFRRERRSFVSTCGWFATRSRTSPIGQIANLLVVGVTRFVLGAAELLFTSTVIQIALALPMAWYFHRATTMALPANALVIPIAGILLPAAVVAVAASYVRPLAGVAACARQPVRPRLADRHHPSDRSPAGLRCSRAHARRLLVCCAAAAAFGLALLLARRRMRPGRLGTCGTAGGRGLDRAVASKAAMAARSPGGHGHRCGPGRFAAAHHSARAKPC